MQTNNLIISNRCGTGGPLVLWFPHSWLTGRTRCIDVAHSHHDDSIHRRTAQLMLAYQYHHMARVWCVSWLTVHASYWFDVNVSKNPILLQWEQRWYERKSRTRKQQVQLKTSAGSSTSEHGACVNMSRDHDTGLNLFLPRCLCMLTSRPAQMHLQPSAKYRSEFIF